MIKPDWNIFKAKFSDNPQLNFEWMCYLLVCNEHGRSTGIFRYKNQSAIETATITIDGKIIGWQAKFYDTALSEHKADMLDMGVPSPSPSPRWFSCLRTYKNTQIITKSAKAFYKPK